MKELSIEEKAKRYDEAIIRGSQLWESDTITRENYEYIFPEIEDSGDERIREALITFFQRFPYENIDAASTKAKEAIAWLEKQGEQKPIVCNNSATIDSELNRYCCKQFNKLYKENGGVLSFARLQNLTIDIYEWCRKQNQNEQNTAEWNEKDSLMLDSIISIVEEWESNQSEKEKEYYGESSKSDWLKSLRPQNTWKPSGEQMKFLWKYAEQNNYDGRILTSLYNDLKKLKG